MLTEPVGVLIRPIMCVVQIDIRIPTKLGLVSPKHSVEEFRIFVALNKAPVAKIKPFLKVAWSQLLVKTQMIWVVAVS